MKKWILLFLPVTASAESRGYYNNALVYNDMMFICIFLVFLFLAASYGGRVMKSLLKRLHRH